MKNFWLILILATCGGVAGAWTINHQRHGRLTARFGPFSMDNDVTPQNVMEVVDAAVPDSLGRVELPDGSEHDFGSMSMMEKGEHAFLVRNIGEGDLNLRVGASTCKCTIGALKSNTIAPGEETEVKLSWEIKPGQATEFSQSAQLITDDPGKVVINMAITGKVLRKIEVVPQEWAFGEVAAGEPFELSGTIYSFFEHDIVPTTMLFSDDSMNELAEFHYEPIEVDEISDGIYSDAKQAFRVNVKVKGGLRQGAVSQNFMFGFQNQDEDGNIVPPEAGDDDPNDYAYAATVGRVVGSLGLLPSSRVKGATGGGYIYDFGRLDGDDELVGKVFVVLKGAESENTKLSIGEVSPAGMLKARLAEPTGTGSTKLHLLEIEVIPGTETIARLGKNKKDYGNIWIESDNPKVTKMRIAVKFAVDPR